MLDGCKSLCVQNLTRIGVERKRYLGSEAELVQPGLGKKNARPMIHTYRAWRWSGGSIRQFNVDFPRG